MILETSMWSTLCSSAKREISPMKFTLIFCRRSPSCSSSSELRPARNRDRISLIQTGPSACNRRKPKFVTFTMVFLASVVGFSVTTKPKSLRLWTMRDIRLDDNPRRSARSLIVRPSGNVEDRNASSSTSVWLHVALDFFRRNLFP